MCSVPHQLRPDNPNPLLLWPVSPTELDDEHDPADSMARVAGSSVLEHVADDPDDMHGNVLG